MQGVIPADQVREFVRHEMIRIESLSGPLPPPHVLEKYEQTLPGLADRIVAMAERQSAHRMELERTALAANSSRSRWGLAAGFTVAVVGLSISGLVAIFGSVLAGTALATVNIAALAGVFVYGT